MSTTTAQLLTTSHDNAQAYDFDRGVHWCRVCNSSTDNCQALMFGADPAELDDRDMPTA